jgi:hypothetical protein
MHGFVYHCLDDDDNLDLHSCCTTNLPEHDDGMTMNLQEQETGQDRCPVHIEEGLTMSKEMAAGINVDDPGNLMIREGIWKQRREYRLMGRSPWEELRPCAGCLFPCAWGGVLGRS